MKRTALLIFCSFTIMLAVIASNVKAQLPPPQLGNPAQLFSSKLSYPINSGIIQGSFTIIFIDKNITIKPNQKFNLSDLGIVAGISPEDNPDSYKDRGLKEYKAKLNSPKNNTNSFYRIKINRENDTTTYYGLISFYNTNESHKDDAVAKYYEIKLSDNLFDQSRGGNLSYNYEFWKKFMAKVPTWLILFSDSRSLIWN